MSNLTIVCGLPGEYKIAKTCFPDATIIQFNHSPGYVLSKYIPNNCKRIISFGLNGGLTSGINVGDICVGLSLTDGNTKTSLKYPPESIWKTTTVPAVHYVPWYSSGALNTANSIEERKALAKATGAKVIDDESYFVNQVALERNIECWLVRSISDDADHDLPPLATGPIMNLDGSTNYSYLIGSLLSHPGQIPDLIRLAFDYSKCLGTLQQAGMALTKLPV